MRLILTGLMLWLLPQTVVALATDRDQPLELEADEAELDNSTGVSIYTGNVVVVQGSMRLEADKLVVHAKDGDVQSMEATGQPAYFRQRPEGEDKDIEGGGLRIDYRSSDSKVILTGKAWVNQGKDELRGARIEYDIDAERVVANRAQGGEQRVRIILQPRNSSDGGN